VALTQLRVRLLGGLTVEGLDEHAVGSRKGRTVLKLLALARGAPVGVERIAGVVWGDDEPARAAEQVGVLVSRLRGVLGAERLGRTDAGYALHCDWLDVDELSARVTEAERRHAVGHAAAARAAAEAALALARGPLLPDEDGEWVEVERLAAGRLVRRAELVLAEAAVDAGQHGTAVAAAEAVLAQDPYDETALRALLRAHVAAGRPAAALAAYARAREQLAEDLGTDPAPATEELHAAILRGEAVAGAPRAAVPPPVPLAGRDEELAAVTAALAAGGAVAVEGEPGIGKTVLLDAAATDAAARGCTVLRCAADVLGNDLPLEPVLDGLATLLRERGPAAAGDVLGADAAVLTPLLALPGAPAFATATAIALPDGPAGQARLFAGLLAAGERAAAGTPLLVVVDDVHVADTATVAWLSYALRRGEAAVLTAGLPGGARLPDAQVVALGPLDIAAAERIVGAGRAAELHQRSGGNPLFLTELARSADLLPETVRDSVVRRADALGVTVAQTLKTAATLGTGVDLDLLANVLDRPVVALLADAERAAAAALLVERGPGYGFANDLVREALAAGTTPARRAYVHRAAARVLADRGDADPRTVAWHARHGGDLALAASALADAGAAAARRYDHDEAERLLDDAVALADTAAVRLARARIRLARWDVTGAADDADRALALGAGPAGLEVRGWTAYYARDYDAAQRYADEGAERAADAAVRESCLALGGRTRHARGLLAEAGPRLAEASRSSVPEVRSVAYVWLATLSAHEGRAAEARDLAERALLDPDPVAAHPFARFHGDFARLLALGMQGRSYDVSRAAERMATEAGRAGRQGARFVPIAGNLRAWPLRALGRFADAADVLRDMVALSGGDPTLAEPHYVARLDLVETLLAAGDVGAASSELDTAAAGIGEWNGTMAWRARHRLGLLTARRDLASGDADAAAARAAAVAEQAGSVGNARHAALARALVARARRDVPPADVEAALADLERCAGLEAWLVTAELAAAYGVERWWADAERRAATLIAGAGPYGDDARRYVERTLDALRR
jgi:DNA-binding SARP family transcriptional activator